MSTCIIVDEVAQAYREGSQAHRHNVSGEIGEDMSTVLLWLIINHLESECMQHAQLAVQASMNTWRRTAFAALLNTRVVPVDDDDGDKQFKDAEALENAVYASRRVDPPDEPWEWAPESRLDLAAKERETSVRKATFVASFKLDPKEKRAKKQKKGGRVGATFEFLFKPPGGPADDEGITIILHGRQPNAEVSATHPSERPIPDMSLGGFDAESKLMTLHGGPPEPIPVPERSIAALVAYLAGPTPGSSSGKEESVKVDAKPRSPFTLSSQDSAEVLTEPGPPEKWHTKALVEDYAAPPGALPKEGGDEFGCLLLESVRALTHEKQLDARRIVTLADRSGKRVAASTTVRREAIIKELSDLDGIWIMTTPGCTADGAQADRATVHVAGGVAVSFAGFEQNKGVATLKFDTAEMLDKDAKVILLDDGGDTAWRLDGARSRDGCVVWVRAPNALKVFAIGGDSAAASSPLSTDKQAVKDHPKLTVWTLCASTYARVGELISFARPPTDDVDGNGTVRSFRLAKQFRVLDGLDDREIFKTAKYPPKDGSGKNLRGGEVLRYISRTPVALDEKNDGDYEIGENNSSKVQMFFYELADGRGFVHDHLPAAPEVRALELVSDGDRWLVDESESVIAEESAEATVPPIIVREVSSLSTLVVTANAGEHFRAHEARFRVHEGDTVRLHTPFAQEWRRAHVVSVARAPRTRARAASMSGGGVEMAFAAPGFSSYKVKYDDAPGGSDPPQWEKLDDLREVVRLAGECDDGVGAHLLPDEYSDATLFQPGDRVEFRERGNSATWLDMESSLVDAADSTEGTVVGGVWMSPLAVNGDEKEGRAPLRLAPGTAVRATIGARDNVVCRVQAANAEGCSYALAETVTTVHADVPAAAVTAFAVRVNDDADDDRSACTYARAIEPSALAEAAAPTTAETLELTCELSLALGLVVDLDCVILRVLADSQFRAVVVDNPDAPSPPPPPPRASMAGTEAALVGGSRWRIASIDDKPVDSRAALMHALAFRQRAALASVAPSASAMSAPAVCKLGLARVRARLLHYDEVGYSGDVPRMGVYSNH